MAEQHHNRTISVHGGKREGSLGVVNAVEPSTAFHHIDSDDQPYPRYFNTPNQETVVEQLRALESAENGLIFSSGMAAISTTLLALLKPGDHIVMQRALYGGTHAFATHEFENAGISYSFTDCDVDSLIAAVKETTRLIYVETPSNPLLEIVDLEKLAAAARKSGVLTAVDNTFASPINQNPVDMGIDLSLHSGTKYLGGHSDVSFGAVLGSQELVQKIRTKAIHMGGNVNAFTCFLIERSLKTLAIRIETQNRNALQIAEFLQGCNAIDTVYYPGLKTHLGHEIAADQMSGFGGMLSFELSRSQAPKEFLRRLELIAPAMSLGGVESTVTIPAFTSHKPMDPAERTKHGIHDNLVRMSVGIESSADLIRDLEQALDAQNSPSFPNAKSANVTG